ncbi:MAG: 2-C-methyl-D-erythritol 2,4-cyclodiphosphate synthase, partial [Bacteroidota bacterium]
SIELLKKVNSLLTQKGFAVGNIDSTVVLETPKIAPYIDAMQKNIASALSVSEDMVSIKATTNEGMGFIGVGEGAVAYAVTTIISNK